MKIYDWLKKQRKKILVHSLILSAFLFYCFFLADPVFDRFERISGESMLHTFELPDATNNIIHNFDSFDVNTSMIETNGWAFIEEQDMKNSRIYLVLKSDTTTHVFDTRLLRRPEVTTYHKEQGFNLDDSGFYAIIPLRKVKPGDYAIGIFIKKGNIEVLQFLDKAIRKTKSTAEVITRMSRLQEVSLPAESNNLRCNIEVVKDILQDKKAFVEIRGWTFIKGDSMENSRIFLVLRSNSVTHVYDTILQKRPDVTVASGESKLNLDDSGFIARIPKDEIENGTYELGICVMNGADEALQYTNKEIHF